MRKTIGKYTPVLISVLFFYSGVYKIVHPGGATYALIALNVPQAVAVAAVAVVTALEIYLSIILLLKIDLRFAIGSTTVLLLTFTALLWYLSTLAHPPSCGCMGLMGIFSSSRKEAMFGILRNCVLLWMLHGSWRFYCDHPKGRLEKARSSCAVAEARTTVE